MAYTVYNKRIGPIGTPTVGITVYGRLYFNKGTTALLKKRNAERVLLLWDVENRKMGIQPLAPSDQDIRAYNVSFNSQGRGSSGITAKTFLD